MRGQLSTSSWRARVYLRLRDREWHALGTLYKEFERDIPLHIAMRQAMQPSRGRTQMPNTFEARWLLFRMTVSTIGVEIEGAAKKRHNWTMPDRVRLRYVEGETCGVCAGPVIKAGWTASHTFVCLACEAPIETGETAHAPICVSPEIPPPPPLPTPVIVKPKPFAAQPVTTFDSAPKSWVRDRYRRDFMRLLKKKVFPSLSLNELERRHRDVDDLGLLQRYLRFLTGWRARHE